MQSVAVRIKREYCLTGSQGSRQSAGQVDHFGCKCGLVFCICDMSFGVEVKNAWLRRPTLRNLALLGRRRRIWRTT